MGNFRIYQSFDEFKREILEFRKKKRLHSITEENLKKILNEIFPGTVPVSEINVSGGREDLNFFIPPSNKKVHFEIFASKSQVPQDLRLLENSRSDLQIAIIIDKDIDQRVIEEYYRKKPSELFPCFELNNLFLEDRIETFKKNLKNLISEIVDSTIILEDYNKVFEESDKTHEFIYSNFFLFLKYPKIIRTFSTNYEKMEIINDIKKKYGEKTEILPFIHRENKIYSFFDLKNDLILNNYINRELKHKDLDVWLGNHDRRNWAIELFNVFIKSYCINHKDLEFDGDKKRYFFIKKDEHDNKPEIEETNLNIAKDLECNDIDDDDEFEDAEEITDMKTLRYFTGIRHQTRRLYWSREDYYAHLAFKLKVITFGKLLYLMILPTFIFTEDGKSLIPPENRSGLYSRYRSKQHNPAILNSIRFLLSYFSDLEDYTKNLKFAIKNIFIEVQNKFYAYKILAGNPRDYRDMYKVLTRGDEENIGF